MPTLKLKQCDLLKIARKTNGHCFYCGNPEPTDIDHFFPNYLHKIWLLKGRTNNDDPENLFLCCRRCNSKKGRKHPEVYLGAWTAWSRYCRANYRVGLSETREYTL